MKILIVDDMKSPHVVVERLIKESTLPFTDILHAYDGEQCLAYIQQESPEIVILDMEMPLLNGTGVLQSLKHGQMPLTIVLSAHTNFDYVQQAIKTDVFDYLLKPIDAEMLLDVLDKAIKKLHKEIYEDIVKYLVIDGESASGITSSRSA